MKQKLLNSLRLRACMLVAVLCAGVSAAWGEKITDYNNIVSGKKYYIGATTGNTDYYLSVDGGSLNTSIAGTAVANKRDATAFTFVGSEASWSIQFENGYYLSLKSGKDNGKVQVVESASTFTASNQSSTIRLSIGNYSIQKNNSGTQFGSYANTQTDVWLEEVPSVAPTTYTVSFDAGDGTFVGNDDFPNASNSKEAGSYTLPSATPAAGYTFDGWLTSGITTPVTGSYTVSGDVAFSAQYSQSSSGDENTKIDLITNSDYSNTSYANFTITGKPSGAEYQGNATKNSGYMQFRATSPSGIVSTVSGGKVKKITIQWSAQTTSERKWDVYGSNTAYSSSADLYSTSTQGEKIGSFTSTSDVKTIEIEGNYAYIGMRSNSNSLYLNSISIEWESDDSKTIMPSISGTTPFLGSTTVTITPAVEGSIIYYTTNGDDPTTSSSVYTEPFTISASTTVKAIAVEEGKDPSDVATKEFVKTSSYKLNETSGLADGDYYLQFDNAVVTYVNGSYNYIEDVNGAILYYKYSSGLKEGDIINGYKLATVKTYNGQFEATSISELNVTAGEAPQPTVITIADLLANTASNMSKYVKLEDVAASADGDGFILSQNGSAIAFYGRNSATVEDGKSYDIIGFLGKHNENYQFVVYTPDHITEVGVEYSEAPVITVAEGTDGAKVVTITAAEGASIYYTTDGTIPTETSNTYTESLTFTEVGSYIVSAIAVEEGKVASSVVTSEFEIVAPPAPAVINLTEGQSISTTSFPSFSGTGYHTVEAYEITMSDGNAYSWSVSDAMKSGDNLQLKASTGSLTSPEIRTLYGYVVTATYTCGSNVAEMTLTSGEASATGTIVDEELGTHEVSLNVESLAAGFTLSTGNRFAYLQSITITALIAFDEKAGNAPDFAAVYNPNVGANKNVKMLREFGSDYWNTLVVPFDLTRAQLEEAFGEDVKVAKYTGFKTPANIKFETTTEDVTRADMMIVKPAATVTNPIFKGVTLEEGKAYEYPYYESNWADGTLFKITGRFAKQVLTDDDFGKVYFLNKQGQFTHPTADGNLIRGFRWFIQLKTPESSTGAKIALDVDGDVTSIDAIDNGQFATDAIYNLSGQRVNKAQKGIYIVNGKKVVVK